MVRSSPPTILVPTQTHTAWGGIEIWIDGLSTWMRRHGWKVVAGLALGRRYNDASRFRQAHPELETIDMDARVGSEHARVLAVEGAIRDSGADVVIPNGIGATYAAVRRIKLVGRDLRLIVPVLSQHPDTLATVLAEWDIVDAVVANNRLSERYLRREVPDGARVHYVVQTAPRALQKRQPVNGPLRVAFVGRFEDYTKRVGDLPRILEALGPDASEIRLELFGDGPDRERVIQAVGHRATWHGYRSKEALYRDVYPFIDVLVLLSSAEGSPNVIYEAMQHGVVPVTSRYLGLASEGVVQHEHNALTFATGDVHAAAAYLVRLARNRPLLEQLGASAAADVHDHSEPEMFAAWERVITQTRESPPAEPHRDLVLPPAGRLDRFLGQSLAHAIRRRVGVAYQHADGWQEWPGSTEVRGERRTAIEAALQALDQSQR